MILPFQVSKAMLEADAALEPQVRYTYTVRLHAMP